MRAPLAAVLAGLLLAGCLGGQPPAPPPPGPPPPPPPSTATNLTFGPSLNVGNQVGYEPSIAVDHTGALYITAHKDLFRPETWPYPGSYFAVSRDGGTTWEAPTSPGMAHQAYVGDEGDIGVDADGCVYFVDTYLADNHLHVWCDQGRQWVLSQPVQKSSGLDDRPWVAAQGSGIVHYLGNNAMPVMGGRHWYYRSTDQGVTWSQGVPIPGNGWSHIDAQRSGEHVYVVNEAGGANAAGDIVVYASHDEGATLGGPVVVGTRDGQGREYPIVSAAEEGVVWVLWSDCGSAANCADDGGADPTRIFLARSSDAADTWQSWDATPFPAFIDYPTVAAGPNGTVAIAFYATTDLPVSAESQWFVWAGMSRAAGNATPAFQFAKASPEPLYLGADLHALHDFFEVAIGPDEKLHVAFMNAQESELPPVYDYGIRRIFYAQGQAAAQG